MRVFSVGSSGRHHVVENPKLAYQWVENLTGPSGFRYIGYVKGIERACMVMGLKVSDYERPYFSIDGIRMVDNGGTVIHREYRNMPGGNGGKTYFDVPIAERECSGSDLDPEWCVTHGMDWVDHDDRCDECGDELENPELDVCPACYVPHCESCGGPHETWDC